MKQRFSVNLLRALLCVAVLFMAFGVSPAHAAGTITVNSNADTAANDGVCTLREAITAANNDTASGGNAGECAAGSGDDTITFDGDYAITLTSALPNILTNMTIDGTGQTVTVSGNGAVRVFVVTGSAVVTIDTLNIEDGKVTGGYGGGIFNFANLTIKNSYFSNNESDGGGAIHNYSNTAVLTIENTDFYYNRAGISGGAILNVGGASMTLTDVEFTYNEASSGAAIENTGSATTAVITNATFANNTASQLGGALNTYQASVTMTNSTIANNSASINGGGMYNTDATLNLTNVTIANNSATSYGGAMFNHNSNPVIKNSIIWGNTAGEMGAGIHNLSGSSPAVTYSIVQGGHAGIGNLSSDPLLGTLTNNGGSTFTMALVAVSPAIDAGTSAGCPAEDQRGVIRPQGGGCDMGAFEMVVGTRYAKPGGADSGDCDTWGTACTLTRALSVALSGEQIFVQEGTHTPDASDRSISFALKNGVGVYGGFEGTETLRSERDPVTHVTILSGDLNGDDVGFTSNGENSYHVVTSDSNPNTTVLDGFTIRGGNADGTTFPDNVGGGIYLTNSSAKLLNLIVTTNNAGGDGSGNGGGIFNTSSASYFYRVEISNNTSDNSGGGMQLSTSNATLLEVAFINNTAENVGGGLRTEGAGTPMLSSVTFSGNSADYGGGVYNSHPGNNPNLTNVTFSNNSATYEGGGISNINYGSPTITNATFSGNSAGQNGGAISNKNDSVTVLKNAILWNNTAPGNPEIYNDSPSSAVLTVTHSIVQGGYTGTGNLNLNPMLTALANNGGFTQTMKPAPVSPAIDMGTNTGCPSTDQRGTTRSQGAKCDMGAVESVVLNALSTGNLDGWVLESGENTNAGGNKNNATSTFNIGDDAANKQYRAVLSFNTASLPDAAVITKVTLKVRRQGVTGGGNPITALGGFMVDIKKGAFGTSALALTDFNAKATKTLGAFKPSLSSGWYTINLTTGKTAISKTGVTQIRLRFKLDDNNNLAANFLKLYSGNAGMTSRPRLIIEYTP